MKRTRTVISTPISKGDIQVTSNPLSNDSTKKSILQDNVEKKEPITIINQAPVEHPSPSDNNIIYSKINKIPNIKRMILWNKAILIIQPFYVILVSMFKIIGIIILYPLSIILLIIRNIIFILYWIFAYTRNIIRDKTMWIFNSEFVLDFYKYRSRLLAQLKDAKDLIKTINYVKGDD